MIPELDFQQLGYNVYANIFAEFSQAQSPVYSSAAQPVPRRRGGSGNCMLPPWSFP